MPSYRQVAYSFGPPLTPMVKKLIIATSVVFALTYIPATYFHTDPSTTFIGSGFGRSWSFTSFTSGSS